MIVDGVAYCDGCERKGDDITWTSCSDKNHFCKYHESLQIYLKCNGKDNCEVCDEILKERGQ